MESLWSACDNGSMHAEADRAESPLTRRLLDLLATRGVPHRVLRHPPVRTSEEAARARGTPLEAGAKALVCHADAAIVLIVVPAHARLDARAFKQQTGTKNVRMVEAGRMVALVGAPVGAVPPFGSLIGLPTYADRAVVPPGDRLQRRRPRRLGHDARLGLRMAGAAGARRFRPA